MLKFVSSIMLLFLATTGCDRTVELEVDPTEQVSEEVFELHLVRNEYPLIEENDLAKVNPATFRSSDGTIELVDLDLKLHLIKFDQPIEGNFGAFFSETEITNQMYATYLADMKLMRDDAELVEASVVPINSTAGAFVNVDSADDLWREGAMPSDREDHPVSLVTVSQGMAFCDWLNDRYTLNGNFRLPFGEEWVFAAYGTDRQYPWGDEEQAWHSNTTHPVGARPELRTPDGLFGMWGNVSELVLSRSDGYGGTVKDEEVPFITIWQGASYRDRKADPRQDYWGYTHSSKCRDSERGFRVCFVPAKYESLN